MIPDRNHGIRSEGDSSEREASSFEERIFEVAMLNCFASSPILRYSLPFNIT
jgi:hypothetical protein